MSYIKHFNIRIYALIINKNHEILLSDEYRLDRLMTKFPGGGLRYGEGPVDCLKREAREELGQEIDIIKHFYTTDFFQKAYFYDDHQLISIYYRARLKEPVQFKLSDHPYDFEHVDGAQSFRLCKIENLSPEDLTFPIDKKVALMLKKIY